MVCNVQCAINLNIRQNHNTIHLVEPPGKSFCFNETTVALGSGQEGGFHLHIAFAHPLFGGNLRPRQGPEEKRCGETELYACKVNSQTNCDLSTI